MPNDDVLLFLSGTHPHFYVLIDFFKVVARHEDLLAQATGIESLEGKLCYIVLATCYNGGSTINISAGNVIHCQLWPLMFRLQIC